VLWSKAGAGQALRRVCSHRSTTDNPPDPFKEIPWQA
jgi:hypothetical protein